MAFNVLQTLLDGIRSLVNWFLKTLPKSVLFLLFLFMIIGIASFIIPLTANSFGYHCDTSGTVWKLPALSLGTNLDLLRHKPNIEEANYQDIPFWCTKVAIATCHNCTTNITGLSTAEECITDGYRLDSYAGLLRQVRCNVLNCKAPEGYFYNYTAGKFQCYQHFCQNQSLTQYDSKIYNTEGATPAYTDIDSKSYRNIVYWRCNKNDPSQIEFTFYGIPVFDLKIWLILMLMGIIIYIIKHFNLLK